MRNHVERFEEEGAFENEAAGRLLKIHLTAVNDYENQKEAEKVVRHLESFQAMLKHQLDHKLISEEAYDFLMADANFLMEYWQ